jgi:hypothetical protein
MHGEAVRQVGRPACRQEDTGRQVGMHAGRKQTDRQTVRHADREKEETGRQVGMHVDRKQTDRKADR